MKYCLMLALLMVSGVSFAKKTNPLDGLLKDAAFTKKSNMDKLVHMNQAITDKKMKAHQVKEYAGRLIWEELEKSKGIDAKLAAYKKITAKTAKIHRIASVEKVLFATYLAENSKMQKASAIDRAKQLSTFIKDKTLGYTSMAGILQGILMQHMATPEFAKLSAQDKVKTLSKYAKDKWVHATTPTDPIAGFAMQAIAGVQADKKKEAYKEFYGNVQFFAQSRLKKAYPDLEKLGH